MNKEEEKQFEEDFDKDMQEAIDQGLMEKLIINGEIAYRLTDLGRRYVESMPHKYDDKNKQ